MKKICNTCLRTWQKSTGFNRNKNNPDGLSNRCKLCERSCKNYYGAVK